MTRLSHCDNVLERKTGNSGMQPRGNTEKQMARVLLVRTLDRYVFPHCATPPLGIMYIASVLREKGSHEVKILDMRLDYTEACDVAAAASEFDADIVGISTLTPEAPVMHQVAQEVKKANAGCTVIAGGPHVSTYVEDGAGDPNIDYVVLGEGEETMSELVEAISSGGDPSRVNGIAFKQNGEVTRTPPREYIQDLDKVPQPAWDLLELEKYFKHWRFSHMGPQPYMAIMTSRGCPFKCIYCHNMLGKKYRTRSAENVFSEIKMVHDRYGISDFEIIDDSFNLDKKRAVRICDLIISSGLKLKLSFPNGVRGDVMDEELLSKLRQAGAFLITYAPETGSARVQKMIRKNVDLEKLDDIISLTRRMGFFTHGFFMLGFPGETEEDLKDTVRFALKAKFHTATFNIAHPFPGTEMYRQAKEMGKKVDVSFQDVSYVHSSLNLSEVDDSRLFAFQKKVFRRFYLSPRRMFWILCRHPYKKGLFVYFILFVAKAFFTRQKEHQRLRNLQMAKT